MPVAPRDPGHDLRLARQIGLADVEQDEDRLLCQETEATDRLFLVGRQALAAQRPAGRQRLMQPLQQRQLAIVRVALRSRPVVAARLQALQPLLHHRKVGQSELEVEPFKIAPGIDRALRVRHSRVFERPDHVQEGVGLAQAGELVGWQLFGPDPALGRGRRRRQVEVGDVGMDDLLGLEDLGQPIEPLVGDFHGPDVQLHAAVAAGLGVAPGQSVEHGRLARAR